MQCCVINVYASYSYAEKIELWNSICTVVEQREDICLCVMGDFNATRRPSERSEQLDNKDISTFNDFITHN